MARPILYHGRNDLDHTVTISIAGQRFEYWLPAQGVESVASLARISLGKALAYAKRHALRWERVQ